MKEQDKKEIRQIFNEGLEQLVLPILDDIYKNMATKKDIKDIRDEMATKKDIEDISTDVDSINRKLDAEIAWRDDASKRLKKVEIKTGLARS